MSMINAMLSHSALALVFGQTSAKGVWDTLERRYTSMSRSNNILGLKRELNSIRKNNDSINVYLAKIKDCRTKLEAVGVSCWRWRASTHCSWWTATRVLFLQLCSKNQGWSYRIWTSSCSFHLWRKITKACLWANQRPCSYGYDWSRT